MMDLLFQSVDQLNAMVEDIAQGGDGKADIDEMIDKLDKIEKGEVFTTEEQRLLQNNASSKDKDDSTELELDEFQVTILGESKERGFDNYEIFVQLSEDCLLKGARVYMVFELLEKHGEVVYSNPTVNDLEEENFDNSFTVLFVTKHPCERN